MNNSMEYLVTDISVISDRKFKVEINYDIQFALYKGEVRRYHIEKDGIIDESVYRKIMDEVLLKRARGRAINRLSGRNMTEGEVRDKLRKGMYPGEIIDNTIDYLKGLRLIDDEYFVQCYLDSYSNRKSIRVICMELYNKGISRDIIDSLIDENNVDEESSIKKLLEKRHFNANESSDEEKNKTIAYLMRKGYDYGAIRRLVIDN